MGCPPTTTIFFTVVSWSAIWSSTGTYSWPTISTLVSASLTMWTISGGARRQFTSTLTALSFDAPNCTSKCSMAFLSRKVTRSCGPTPSAASAFATRLETSSSWR